MDVVDEKCPVCWMPYVMFLWPAMYSCSSKVLTNTALTIKNMFGPVETSVSGTSCLPTYVAASNQPLACMHEGYSS